jgi:hypothetical protein
MSFDIKRWHTDFDEIWNEFLQGEYEDTDQLATTALAMEEALVSAQRDYPNTYEYSCMVQTFVRRLQPYQYTISQECCVHLADGWFWEAYSGKITIGTVGNFCNSLARACEIKHQEFVQALVNEILVEDCAGVEGFPTERPYDYNVLKMLNELLVFFREEPVKANDSRVVTAEAKAQEDQV